MIIPLFIIPITALVCILFDRVYFKIGAYNNRLYKIIALIAFYFNLFYGMWLWATFPRISAQTFDIVFPAGISTANGFLFEVQTALNLPFVILSTFILIIGLLTA
jgi:hypothetical protein